MEGWLPLPRMSFNNAAKAAVISFYETLAIKLGEEVGITIVTPGWIESDMTRGRYLTENAEVHLKEEPRDINLGPYPVSFTEECAKRIVSGARSGERYVRIPVWYNVFFLYKIFLYKIFVPDLVDWTTFRFQLMEQQLPGHQRYYVQQIAPQEQQPLVHKHADSSRLPQLSRNPNKEDE